MVLIKVFFVIAACSLNQAQLLNPNTFASHSFGNRVEGDRFLIIAHKMSPFFTEPSTFETTFEVIGGNYTRIEITSVGVSSFAGSSFGSFENVIYLAQIKHYRIIVTQTYMRVYGFEKPTIIQSTP